MGRRTLLLIASILVAAVGTALIGLYVRGADTRAQRNQNQVVMLVATESISAGTPVANIGASVARQRLLQTTARPGYSTVERLQLDKKDQTVTVPILPGQQIVPDMFGDAANAQSGLKEGRRGVAVELTDPARAAGLLAPGSRVTVYSIKNGTASPLLPDALILRIGNQRSGSSTSTTSRGTTTTSRDDVPRTIVTFDLPDDETAERVVKAQAAGDLYFAVHGAGQ